MRAKTSNPAAQDRKQRWLMLVVLAVFVTAVGCGLVLYLGIPDKPSTVTVRGDNKSPDGKPDAGTPVRPRPSTPMPSAGDPGRNLRDITWAAEQVPLMKVPVQPQVTVFPPPLRLGFAPTPDAPSAAFVQGPAATEALPEELRKFPLITYSEAKPGYIADDAVRAKAQYVMSLCEDQQGRLWVGCEDTGVFCYDPAAVEGQRWRQFTRQSTGGPEEKLGPTIEAGPWLGDDNGYAIACDHQNRTWVGHLNHGVSVYNGKEWRNYGVLEGPIGERVFAIKVCPEIKGESEKPTGKTQTPATRSAFANPWHPSRHSALGAVWIATSAGISIYHPKEDDWSYLTRADGLPSDQIQAIAFDAEGNVYLGTQCDGVAMAEAKDGYRSWRVVTGPDKMPTTPTGTGLPTNLINDVLVAKDGTVYAATTTGLAWSKDKGKNWQYARGRDYADKVRGLYGGPPKGWKEEAGAALAEDYVTCLAQDVDGRLWTGYRSRGCQPWPAPPIAGGTGPYVMALTSFSKSIASGIYDLGVMGLPAERRAPQPPRAIAALPSRCRAPTDREIDALVASLRSVPKAPATQPVVVALPDDWLTQGDWLGHYGRYWACLCAICSPTDYCWGAGEQRIDYCATIGPHCQPGDSVRYWVHLLYTSERRSLELPPVYLHSRVEKGLTTWDMNRRQAEWDDHSETYAGGYDGPSLYTSLRVPAGTYYLSLYAMNKDGHTGANRLRDFPVSVRQTPAALHEVADFETWPELSRSRLHQFWDGVYKRFLVRGPIALTVALRRNGSHATILSGVFLDSADEFPAPYYLAGVSSPTGSGVGVQVVDQMEELLRNNPRSWATVSREVYRQALARASEGGQAASATRGTTFYYRLALMRAWDQAVTDRGLVTAREIEKSLRWDGRTQSCQGHGYRIVSASALAGQYRRPAPPATEPARR